MSYWLKATTVPEALVELSEVVQKELSTLEKRLDDSILLPKKYMTVPRLQDFVVFTASSWGRQEVVTLNNTYNWWKYLDGSYNENSSFTKEQLDNRLVAINEALAKYKAACDVVAEQNKEISQHNAKVIEKVEIFMGNIGVPSKYTTSEYKSSRSSKKTTTTHSAGYLGDLQRLIGSVPCPTDMRNYITQSQEQHRKLSNELIQKANEEAKKVRDQENLHKLAALRVKYTPEDFTSTARNLLDGLLDKCKYLRLAHYLQENRNDWNDGYSYAECGLDGFTTDTPEDVEIYECINNIIQDGYENGDIDGRIFRDCEYDYGALYGMTDPDLYKDYQIIINMLDD